MNESIGFIGAGNMGRPFIAELLRQGYAVSVHDFDPGCAAWADEHGAAWAPTPAQAAEGAAVLITCLPLPCHVRHMMIGTDGALAGLSPGAIWVDTSTTDYHNTLEIAALAAARGVLSLEAPVSNLSHMGVDFNNVCFYAGGTASAYAQVEPVLRVMGQHALHVGAIGTGQSVKLLTNLLFYCATLVWAELLIVAQTHGIDLHWLWETAKKGRGNCFVVDQITPLLLDGSYDHSCTLEITVKDTALVVSLADELEVPLALGRLVEQRYRQARYSYPARANHLKVVHLLERENDRRLQIPGFTAPSPYGANRDYCHPAPLHTDARGRVKPHVPPQYRYTLGHPAWAEQAQCLSEVMAWSNALILREALELGRAMGLGAELLDRVVSMSCGPSWVSDNAHSYQPDRAVLREFAGLVADLHLPILHTLDLGTPSTANLGGYIS